MKFFIALFLLPFYSSAQETKPLKIDSTTFLMPQIVIIEAKDKLFTNVPGSVSVIGSKEITQIQPLTGNELLRKVPGVNIVDEEGAGLRINVGIRGLDADRSRNILVLEDGIPVSLGPYGEPELYFTPQIDKMSGIEVLKGSGQILFGPQTTGGVLNYLTADPAESETIKARLTGGANGFFSGFASYSNTIDKTGFIVSYLHKRADNLGMTNFSLHDLSAKIKIETGKNSIIGLKLGFYNEISNSTYIGINQVMYDRGGQDFVQLAPEDILPIRRYNGSVTHELKISNVVKLQTTAFAYTTSRNWRRQDFSTDSNTSNKTGVVWGDPRIPGGAIYMKNSTGNRNRQFEVAGIESKFIINYQILKTRNVINAGARYLFEKANEQFIIGKKFNSSAGDIRDNEKRIGNSVSFYAQNKTFVTKKLNINIGLRFENFNYERNILRGRFTVNNVANVVRDTLVVAKSNVQSFIPGAGINYSLNENINIFGGIHKGFAPPRIKDAITNSGVAIQLDAELSTNYELGSRIVFGNFGSLEATAFILDFKNQIIPISQSSGSSNQTGLANGGETFHQGIEAAFNLDFGKIWKSQNAYTLEGNITIQKSTYNADRFLPADNGNVNVNENSLPYAPNKLIYLAVGTQLKNGLGFRLSANYVDEQFTNELNTVTPTADGRNGLIENRTVVDANVMYRFYKNKIGVNLAVKNVLDQRYIASRRPEGIRVGLSRMAFLGLSYNL